MNKVACAIPSLDMLFNGGVRKGSLILLLGEVGSGHYEFVYTSMIALSNQKKNVCYISMTRSHDDILSEVRASFANLEPGDIEIKNLSESYFKRSQIPLSWITDDKARTLSLLKDVGQDHELLKEMVKYLDNGTYERLIVIDSLTSLLRSCRDESAGKEFIKFLQGLQRVSKRWSGPIYLILTANIFEQAREEEIADLVDGVFVFRWEDVGSSVRRRSMSINEFRGELSRLEDGDIVKFEVNISPYDGLSLIPIHQILGRD
jgi:KaiC/GvpD/RAD55 family RecA-like ATPase